MKTNLVKSFCVLLLVLFVVSGCKKSSDDTPSTKYQAPSLATSNVVVQVPSKLQSSSDPYAQTAAGYMAMANAFSAYSSFFTVPSNASQSTMKSSGIVYTWSSGGITIKLTYNDDGTNRTWVWYFNDVKYMDCQEAYTGKSGSFNVYDIEHGGAVVLVYNWNKDASAINQTMKLIGTSETYFFKISASLDGKSGQFDLYEGASEAGNHIVKITWKADGSGTWWVNYNGEVYSGTWSATSN